MTASFCEKAMITCKDRSSNTFHVPKHWSVTKVFFPCAISVLMQRIQNDG